MASPIIKATDTYPWTYRFMLTTLEPIFAFLGAIQVLVEPSRYLSVLTRDSGTYNPDTKFLYTTMAGAWLVFAFNEAVVLRLVDDARIWRILVWGMLLSDVLYCQSCAEAVGGWANWADLSEWTVEDWVVLVTTVPPVTTRVLIAAGIGTRDGGKTAAKRK